MNDLSAERESIKSTCPRDCYDACGLLVVREKGKILKVLGDPDHHVAQGALCGKCAIAYNGAWRSEDLRLLTPLVRVGKKGEGKFEPTSWDNAISLVVEKLKLLAENNRADRVLHAHYTGTVGLIGGWYPLRFLNHYGATEVDPDTVCNKAGHSALGYVFGTSLEGFDPESIADAEAILVWGANPSHSAPHMHKHWLRNTKAKIITIDPIAHRTASELAHIHLQLRPGTDAALAFGLLHVIKNEGLLDEQFINNHVHGFEQIIDAIDASTPEVTERLTGLSKQAIEAVAKLYASGPSLIWLGQGMQRTTHGGNAFRAIASLAAATGNIGKKGTGICYMNGPQTRGIDMDILTAPEIAKFCKSISHMDLADTLLQAEKSEVFLTWNCNPLASSPDQNKLRKALAREELFTIACDVFYTDTVDYADVVFPAASFLEFNDIVAPYFHHTLSAQVKVQEPMGQSLPNQEIFRRIAKGMGYSSAELFESDDQLIQRLIECTTFQGDFELLAKQGTVRLFDEPRVQFEDKNFPTPSGKIEVASELAKDHGLPFAPEPHADQITTPGKLRLLSPASVWQMNSSYANDPKIQRQLGLGQVILHPEDGATYKVEENQEVVLKNQAGQLRLRVKLSEISQPGVAIVYKGRWPKFEKNQANVNALHYAQKSDIAESTSVHSTEVTLIKAGDVL